MIFPYSVEQHAAISVDDGQQIVEIVRHSAGEAADALQFVGLLKLIPQFCAFLFGVLTFRDVPDNALSKRRPFDYDSAGTHLHRKRACVLPSMYGFEYNALLLFKGPPLHVERIRPRGRAQILYRHSNEFFPRVADRKSTRLNSRHANSS